MFIQSFDLLSLALTIPACWEATLSILNDGKGEATVEIVG